MRRNTISRSLVIIALIMLSLPSVAASASIEVEPKVTATALKTAAINETAMEIEGEPTLQEWFDINGYAINVTEDELGIETFEAGYYQIAILAEIAGFASSNNLSWYLTSSDEQQLIFSESNTTGDTTIFKATETFGLSLGTPDGLFYNEPDPHLFYTETSRNPDSFDHALVFPLHVHEEEDDDEDDEDDELCGYETSGEMDEEDEDEACGYIIVWEDLWEGGDKDFQDMILAMFIPVIEAEVRIRPRTLNLKSKGRWIKGFIELPQDYDVGDIDASTIMLNGTIPVEPKRNRISESHHDKDNKKLKVKFSRAAVIEYIKNAIMVDEDSSKRMEITLTISGNLFNGQAFEGSTRIWIIHFRRCVTT